MKIPMKRHATSAMAWKLKLFSVRMALFPGVVNQDAVVISNKSASRVKGGGGVSVPGKGLSLSTMATQATTRRSQTKLTFPATERGVAWILSRTISRGISCW